MGADCTADESLWLQSELLVESRTFAVSLESHNCPFQLTLGQVVGPPQPGRGETLYRLPALKRAQAALAPATLTTLLLLTSTEALGMPLPKAAARL